MIENLTHPLYNFKPKYSFKWQPFFANISLLLSARISCLRSKKMSSLLQKQSNDPVSVPIYNLILERSFRRFPCISKIMKLINKASRKQLLDGVVPFTCIGSNPSGEELKKMKKMLSQEEKERKGKKQKKHNRRLKTGEAEQQSKVSADGFPTDYVCVRARRGEATDSHSLAERARREKISMRMNLLQSLVPGCEKITGKAHILDEIIKYVQSLQNQVESLAAKLAFVDLMLYNCEQNPSTNPCVPERICCLEPPMPSVPESSSVQYRSFPEAAPTSPSPLLTEDQRGSLIPQDGGDFLLDMDDQYIEDIVNEPTGLDNLCTF